MTQRVIGEPARECKGSAAQGGSLPPFWAPDPCRRTGSASPAVRAGDLRWFRDLDPSSEIRSHRQQRVRFPLSSAPAGADLSAVREPRALRQTEIPAGRWRHERPMRWRPPSTSTGDCGPTLD